MKDKKTYSCKKCKGEGCNMCNNTGIDPVIQPEEVAGFRDNWW